MSEVASFKGLSVGQEFHFPAHPEAFGSRSQAYVKLSPRGYAERYNFEGPTRRWSTYRHEVGTTSIDVEPGPVLSAEDLAEVLRAVDETQRQDRAYAKRHARPARRTW